MKAVRLTGSKQDYDLLRVRVDVVDSFLNSGDLLGLLVRDFGLEFLFQSHHQLNGIKGVGTQVFDEGSAVGNFLFLDAKLLGNDFLDAFFDGAHTLFSLLWKNQAAGLRGSV
ncbi:3-oxoacyl-(Acyl carrier protein) synthase II (Modular protein) (fragment) [Pseudomonas sp. 9Ag]